MNFLKGQPLKRQIAIHAVGMLFLIVFFILSYESVLNWLYDRYVSEDSYYSHGFMVPFVCLFLIWLNRKKLIFAEKDFSWFGLTVLLMGIGMHILAKILFIYSLSGFSILFVMFGLSLFIFGTQNTRILLFPIAYLIFMLPLPTAVINAIAFPLKMLVAKLGVDIVRLTGIPIYSEGFDITIPAGNLLVGNPCSGLRSLITFLALGSIYAYISDLSTQKKWVLFFISVPVAIFSNIIRVPILILVSHYYGLEAGAPDSFWHDASGIFMFVIGLILIYFSGKMLGWKTSGTDI